jgi:DNA-binding LacI/PurR family transcriptional regulator
MQSTPLPGRPADRRKEIVRELRAMIVRGLMPPGSQLPTRLEIESRFGVSPLTVQRALERLREDGFITVNGRQGTYVAEHPPHLTNYVLAFPHTPSGPSWVRFWTALTNEALNMAPTKERRLSVCHNINGEQSSQSFLDLVEDVKAHRVAGLIFASPPHLVQSTPLVDEPNLPRVAIASPQSHSGCPIVDINRASFFQRALEAVAASGRTQVACIGLPNDMQDEVRDGAKRFGLETRPIWWQGVHVNAPEMARNIAHLLMSQTQAARPDALIISDDNLVEHVMGGLTAAGVRVPKELEIIAHCNFPWPAPSVLPAQRLGFDARAVLRTSIELIDRQRRGETVPPVTKIEAVFEEELRRKS